LQRITSVLAVRNTSWGIFLSDEHEGHSTLVSLYAIG
jgi:hypothetical protein